MATLKVTSPFTVKLPPPEKPDPDFVDTYVFPEAGTYDDVPKEVADHWFTQGHLEGYEAPEMAPLDQVLAAGGGAKVMVPKPEPPTNPKADPQPAGHGTHSSKSS